MPVLGLRQAGPEAHMTRRPTIYEALRDKLGREPTNKEIKADVRRINEEVIVDLATRGKLPHQRKRAGSR